MKTVKLNLSTKEVKVDTIKINTNVSREMIDDLRRCTSDYVSKSLVKPIDNIVIKIYDDKNNNRYYRFDINIRLRERYSKIYNITKNEDIKRILDIVSICENNRKNWVELTEDVLVEELSENINKEILRNIMKLGMINHGKSNI